ncbi:MAG: tripartite motif-containing protein 71 [Thermoleophilaceae bacterium]|nr:tripartite motif-containing protein 71 [Thermoleophilaceae bacterium]
MHTLGRVRTRLLLVSLAVALLASAAPAMAVLRVAQVFGTQGSAPGQLNQPEDVTTDGAGNVYVANTANARVDKYSPDGVYVQSFGSRGSAAGQLGLPIGVAIASGGEVWVSDNDGSRGRVTVYNPDGSVLRTFGSVGTGDGQFRSPGPVALDAAGNAYIVDTSNQRVQKFTSTGAFITKWGSAGSADGQFNNPRGITVDPSGNVLVADRDNQRIQRFSPDGAFLGKFGTPATTTGNFGSVYDVAAAPSGDLFTADNNLFDIEKFLNTGEFVFQANPANTFDGTAAQGLRPVSVTVGPGGVVYAVGSQGASFVAKFEQVPPQPVLAQSATALLVKGTVLVKAPGATTATPLTKDSSLIKVGSSVDATHGTVKLVTATGKGTNTQSGQFGGGAFGLLQSKKGHGLTDLVMRGGTLPKVCSSTRGRAQAAATRERHLFSNAHGRFRTRGRYSTATVRGTKWLTKDTCKGTLTKVTRGTVTVRDLVKRRNIKVKAGHSYLAKPKGHKKLG